MAKTTHYVALLRGINVGGKNLIPMAALKACFEAQELANVATFIASGNVLFESSAKEGALTRTLERALSTTFGYEATVLLRSRAQLDAIVDGAPRGFGRKPKERRYDVLFLRAPLTADEALEAITVKEGVDEVAAGPGVVYASRLIAKASQSRLSRITASKIYPSLTIRNWNTTTKLAALLAARA